MKFRLPKIKLFTSFKFLTLFFGFCFSNKYIEAQEDGPYWVYKGELPWGKVPPEGVEAWFKDYPTSATYHMGPISFSNEIQLQSNINKPISPLLPQYTFLLRRTYILIQLDTNSFSHEDIEIISATPLANQQVLESDLLLVLPDVDRYTTYTPSTLRNFDGIHYLPEKEMFFTSTGHGTYSEDSSGSILGRYIPEGMVTKIICSLEKKFGSAKFRLSCDCDSLVQPARHYMPRFCPCCVPMALLWDFEPYYPKGPIAFDLEVDIANPIFSYDISDDSPVDRRRAFHISNANFFFYYSPFDLRPLIRPILSGVPIYRFDALQVAPFFQYQFYGIAGE